MGAGRGAWTVTAGARRALGGGNSPRAGAGTERNADRNTGSLCARRAGSCGDADIQSGPKFWKERERLDPLTLSDSKTSCNAAVTPAARAGGRAGRRPRGTGRDRAADAGRVRTRSVHSCRDPGALPKMVRGRLALTPTLRHPKLREIPQLHPGAGTTNLPEKRATGGSPGDVGEHPRTQPQRPPPRYPALGHYRDALAMAARAGAGGAHAWPPAALPCPGTHGAVTRFLH